MCILLIRLFTYYFSKIIMRSLNYLKNSINLKNIQRSKFKCVTASTTSTIIIDLSLSEEELWKGVKSKTRNIIRRSVKNNVTVHKVAPSKNFVEVFFPLLEETFSRKGEIPHDYETFLKLLTGSLSSNFDCFEASLNKEIVFCYIFENRF